MNSYLFLQGVSSPFFPALGQALRACGHEVHRLNFNGGDRHFWRKGRAYHGGLEGLDAHYRKLFSEIKPSHLVLFGDQRPVHLPAIALAEQKGLDIWVFEEGYFRPHWVTLEWGGVNGRSWLSTDPDWYRREAASLPAPVIPTPFPNGFSLRRRYDLQNSFFSYLGFSQFPKYRTHRPYTVALEYAGWLYRLSGLKAANVQAQQAIDTLAASKKPYWVLPLQLDPDFQVRVHSSFGGMLPAVAPIIRSFARHAPSDAVLVVKNHPLHNGLIFYEKHVRALAVESGIPDRVLFIDGGNLDQLVAGSKGMVLINSTTGFAALEQSKPLITLGKALYDLPGLTFQGPLDAFWAEAGPPDGELSHCFRRVLAHYTLVNGDFYTPDGIAAAVQNSLAALERKGGPYDERPPSPMRKRDFPKRV
ncbi:MAG: capsule biosynthesis protein [Magnetospiraceae bacterium]